MFGAPLQISAGFASWQRYCTASSSGRQPNYGALNRGRHLCLAGRPSGWALAHILVFFFFWPNLSEAITDWISTILLHMVWISANLECRSEICCTRLAGSAGPKNSQNSPSEHHHTTLSGCILSLQLRHVSAIGKKTC